MNSGYSSDPLEQFRAWFEKAGTDVMALATAAADGAPSARMVLLKGADELGFVFFTNHESRKGRDLDENPRAALLFHWPQLGRQVRVEGAVERVSDEESDAYFRTRPRGAQLAAWASRQSDPVESRETLEARFAEFEVEYAGEVPRPPHWGGYRLAPEVYEFWQHRDNRLHDRFRFRRDGSAWVVERLSP